MVELVGTPELHTKKELYNSEGKPVIFIYKAQIKKGKRNLPKKHQMIGEIIEAKNGMYFVGSDIESVDAAY